MIAVSAVPVRRASAHCEGTVKERSYLSRRPPCVNPRTSGAVLRYCTTEMRSFVTLHNYSRRYFAVRRAFKVKLFSQFEAHEFGGSGDVETFVADDCGDDIVLRSIRSCS